MLRPQELSQNHEEVFLQRYRWLLGWALQLTNHDRHKAENLVHDAFVQFVLSQPDLHQIRNLEAYLYTTLKNTHLSQARRTAKDSERQFSLVEYDSAELGLRQGDPRPNLQMQDELRQICRYTIMRKETSKAASVLILRFFHGYYPSEISQILCASIAAVKKLLQMARSEARLFLHDPTALAFLSEPTPVIYQRPATSGANAGDLLNELVETFFQSPTGECPGRTNLRAHYSDKTKAIECSLLSHLVSCRACLEQVNGILGLPSLAERSPEDMTGNDPGGRSGFGGGSTTSGSGGGSVGHSRRRLKETFEHYPKELRIAVNGFDLGSQKVNSELIEQDLKLNVGEPISFVEISSEQGVRLLLLNVEQPPEAPVEQRAQIILSEDRKLEAALSFRSSWPTLHMLYHDPTFAGDAAATTEAADQNSLDSEEPLTKARSSRPGFKAKVLSLGHKLLDTSFWLRPATVTALFAVLLLGVAIFFALRRAAPIVSAADLLERSALAEDALLSRTDVVVHRTINLEEKKLSGDLIARRRVELWQNAEKGITARRLFDDQGSLIAGDWRRSDGVQTLYHHGARPRLQLPNPNLAIRSFDAVWQLSLSAKEFSALIGSASVKLEAQNARYVISYAREGERSEPGLVRATLVLGRDDLRAIEQTLSISDGREQREFRFTETGFERRAPDAVAPAVFDPEPQLLGTDTETRRHGNAENITASPRPPAPASSVVATVALEVEVLRILNSAGADLGEQVSVHRTADGQLRIEGLVETAARKAELLHALRSISDNPAVQIRISTVAEALSKQKPGPAPAAEVVAEGTNTGESMPAYSDLRRHFAAKGESGDQLERDIQRFATRVTNLSYQTVQRAMALKRLAGRFSQEDLRAMDAEARAQWLALVRSQSRTLQQEIVGLRKELSPIFPSATSDGGEEADVHSDAELMQVADRLFTLCSEYDRAIHSALTLSPDSSVAAGIRSQQFGRNLHRAEKLSMKISLYR